MNDYARDCAFPLLGSRTYLHGTTLFDAMLEYAPAGAELGFRIPHRIDSDRVRLVKQASKLVDRSRASLVWTLGDDAGSVVAESLDASDVPARMDYPENRVIEGLEITSSSVILRSAMGMSFVSTLIPMFKTLLRDAPVQPMAGQWMFTRLDVGYPAQDFTPLTLRRDALVPGKLARASIEVGERKAGEIYFSWVTAK